ncbi:hypothetical protein OH492_23035 [Vibrio chagasii]|nr:hypothetical protein [Vibrio chagasii]
MVMAEYCAEHRADVEVLIPQLPEVSRNKLPFSCGSSLIGNNTKDQYQIALVGSSLGGYLSTKQQSLWL